MLRKHGVLLSLIAAILLLLTAMTKYPGGNWIDLQAPGFDWTRNFISNLFQAKALNGMDNPARWWADAGMIMVSVGFATFFMSYASRIPQLGAQRVIRWSGLLAMVCMALVVTPLHGLMVGLSSSFILLSLFYITVFVLRSRLRLFKWLCVACMLVAYYTLYLYGYGQVEELAIMQKVSFVSITLLVLSLQYFTRASDFEPNPRVEA